MKKKWFQKTYCFVAGFSLFMTLSGVLSSAQAAPQPIPTVEQNGAPVPDWSQISFNTLPGISRGGSFSVPNSLIQQLGYDPSRQWSEGDTPEKYMMLGDFQDTFRLQEFSLDELGAILGVDLSSYSLADFGLVAQQTLNSLVEAVPELLNYPINEISPILDLVQENLAVNIYSKKTIGNLLNIYPKIGEASFASIALEQYSIGEIPGLAAVQLQEFSNWQGIFIEEVLGLAAVPFAYFPQAPVATGGGVGFVDLPWSRAEEYANRSISGSNKEGFRVSCQGGCSHVELAGSPGVAGVQWVSGIDQEVKGGKGILGSVNDGQEPTGRHPFGDAFKVAVWEINETKGTVDSSLFFQICIKKTFVDLGCTPYFIGPVPFLNYQEGDPIFLGL